MEKIYLIVCVVVLFISCNITGRDNNNNHHSSLIGKSQKEIEKLQEPTENVEKINDDFSGTSYVWQKNPNVNGYEYELCFDNDDNKVSLVHEGSYSDEKFDDFKLWVCLRKIDNNQIKFDFTPFEKYAENYNIDMFLSYNYASLKEMIEVLEKKSNRTQKEERDLENAKDVFPYYTSIEKYKEIDPTLKVFNEDKLVFQNSAKIYKDMNPIGTISADKSTITFPKFFFCYFENVSDDQPHVPRIYENVVFKKR